MFNDLAQIFETFLTNVSNNNQWTYIFVGLIIFIILLNILCNMIKERR